MNGWLLLPLAAYCGVGVATTVIGRAAARQSIVRAVLLGVFWPLVLASVLSTVCDDARS